MSMFTLDTSVSGFNANKLEEYKSNNLEVYRFGKH